MRPHVCSTRRGLWHTRVVHRRSIAVRTYEWQSTRHALPGRGRLSRLSPASGVPGRMPMSGRHSRLKRPWSYFFFRISHSTCILHRVRSRYWSSNTKNKEIIWKKKKKKEMDCDFLSKSLTSVCSSWCEFGSGYRLSQLIQVTDNQLF